MGRNALPYGKKKLKVILYVTEEDIKELGIDKIRLVSAEAIEKSLKK